MGKSLVERDKLTVAREVLDAAKARGVEMVLPKDLVVADSLDAPSGTVVAAGEVPAEMMALDIGPDSVEHFAGLVAAAETIFWNGPMGVFEKEPFSSGTTALAKAVAASGALSVVGGGDSVSAIHKAGLADGITHISTGGGASLEMMEGKELPGIAALKEG